MRKRLFEEMTLFASVVKWTAYALLVGTLVGASTTVFLKALAWATGVAGAWPHCFLLLPLALLASLGLVRWLAPDAEGHGTEKVIEAVHTRMGHIPLMVVPVKLVATVITLVFGGSAGKEGPCAQIGAGLASGVAGLFRLNDVDRRKLVICGISGGFAAVFGTPIAGALFGVEVLFLGQVLYDVLFPSFVAGITSYHISSMLGITYFGRSIEAVPPLTSNLLLEMVLLGIWCGLAAFFLIESMRLADRLSHRMPWGKAARAAAGGLLLVAVGLAVSPRYLGLGLDTVEAGLDGARLPADAFFWKTLTTSTTLACGGSGGIITPIFFVGASAGNLFARLFHPGSYAIYSAIGVAALLAGAANTPLSASVMAMELFGPKIGPLAAVACTVSFLLSGHRSVYPSQVLAVRKSASLAVTMGRTISEVNDVALAPRPKTLIAALRKLFRKRGDGGDAAAQAKQDEGAK